MIYREIYSFNKGNNTVRSAYILCIKRIRDLFEYALYKFRLYLLYLLTSVMLDTQLVHIKYGDDDVIEETRCYTQHDLLLHEYHQRGTYEQRITVISLF